MKKIFTMFVLLAFLAVGSTCLFSMIQVGEEVFERCESPHPYSGVKGVVWEKIFHYPQAGYIAIHFRKFELAPGDKVVISDPTGRFVYRYTGKGKVVRGGKAVKSNFWATHIPGDTAIVKLYSNANEGFGFVIDKWARGYDRDYIETVMNGLEAETLTNSRSICGADDKEWAKCYDGTEMYNKARAVCRLLIGGTSACTGWLLGSEGHVMTNNHCISTQSSASDTDYEFMAEGATCATNCGSWGACPGTIAASSGTMIQTNSTLDFTLILLPTNVSTTYGYLQLRDTLPSVGERIYIPQHPGAYGKQLAVESDTDGPYCKVYTTSASPCMGGPGDIGYYADTAGGSSGSPVIAYNDNLVISLHHCGTCPNIGVPIPSIITSLGANLPDNAIGGAVNPPVANFSGSPTTVMVGGTVTFTDLSTNSPTSLSWTFEGGTPSSSTAKNPVVTYNTAGTYDVTLIATNAVGSDTETKLDYITVTALQPPVANFTASSTSISIGQNVTFTDTSSNNPTSWSWTFEGGTPSTSTAKNPVVTYNTAGTFDVTLIATNAAGSDTETKLDYITVSSVSYCTASSTNWTEEWISRVVLSNLNNSSGASGYTNFTALSANLTRGTAATVTVTVGYSGTIYTEYLRIFIDYNHDGDFAETNERVFSKYAKTTISGSFTPPTSALTGATRMRVTLKYGGYASYCGTFTYGEVEDYTVNIN